MPTRAERQESMEQQRQIAQRPRRAKKPTEGDGHTLRVGRTPAIRPKREIRKLVKLCNAAASIMRQLSISQRRRSAARSAQKAAVRSNSRNAVQQLQQRAAVRVTYKTPKSAGHWKAHGRYLQRESAAGAHGMGFNADGNSIDMPSTLNGWQQAGDERIFSIIVSPENGSRLDMEQYAKDIMRKVESDHGGKLEWVGIIHTNTDHPHVHIAIRGLTHDGKPLQFQRDYIKNTFRETAQEMATQQLGYRSREDMQRQTAKEITQYRATSLDRLIARAATKSEKNAPKISISTDSAEFKAVARSAEIQFALTRRLNHLETMGMAQRSDNAWTLDFNFIKNLTALQTAGDKQKMMHRHMAPASSTDQPITALKWTEVTELDARVLGHGEEEDTGRRFMIVESTDGTIIQLPHRKNTDELRASHILDRNNLVTFTRDSYNRLQILDHGNANAALKKPDILRKIHITPTTSPRPGWLGQLDIAVASAHTDKTREREQEHEHVR